MNAGRSGSAAGRAWQALAAHHAVLDKVHMRDLFAADPHRAARMSLDLGSLHVDWSKHRATEETLRLLLDLAGERQLGEAIRGLFAGAPLNRSEQRAALHSALRAPAGPALRVGGNDIMPGVHAGRERMLELAAELGAGRAGGVETVVNLGIGGSDLGPRLVADALADSTHGRVRVEFVANVDPRDLRRVLERCNPATTLFLVVSKSFRTVETLLNADSARRWLGSHGRAEPAQQFIAVTGNAAAARSWGIAAERIFDLPDWVGGRYSLWSAAGLAAAIRVGPVAWRELLAGAHAMDRHFLEAEPGSNLPWILGLLDVWYRCFFGAETVAVVPYDERLRRLPEHLGQLLMESNGKSVDLAGRPLPGPGGPIVWGAVGSNAQHAFFQLLHQGTQLVPVDFLVGARSDVDAAGQRQLLASCIAQSAALMAGRDDPAHPERACPGNRPSTTLLYRDLDACTLGMLLALYEHRTFVLAQVLGLNPFDQWGVELGKELARNIVAELAGGGGSAPDSSSALLLETATRLAAG